MQTKHIKKFLDDVGDSIHSMNTIAVSLSHMSPGITVPAGLNVSWQSKDLEKSKKMSRNFALRAAIVYSVESLFNYILEITKDPFWVDSERNFEGNDPKAIKTFKFLNGIEGIEPEWPILVELLCHWRNKVVHGNSNSRLFKDKIKCIQEKKDIIWKKMHHFDVSLALNNYEKKLVTLKDVSTLITITIKCVRKVEEYYIRNLPKDGDIDKYIDGFNSNDEFRMIWEQQKSEMKYRKIERWISMNYASVSQHVISGILIKAKGL